MDSRERLAALTRDELDRLAAARGVTDIEGTGPDGQVADADVIDAIAAAEEPPTTPAAPPAETAGRMSAAVPIGRPKPPGAVTVNQYTRRDDNDVLPGTFGEIVNGPHAGRVGVFVSTVSVGDDGYPEVVAVRLRDNGAVVNVDYAYLVPTTRRR